MLNITKNKIDKKQLDISNFSSNEILQQHKVNRLPLQIFLGLVVLGILAMFLPWTQTISAKGKVTTLEPQQRPQSIQPVISGQIEKWYVKEGDFVEKGDTIIYLSEVKPEYFDPNLINRTQEQIQATENSVSGYGSKMKSLGDQKVALQNARDAKLEQTNNKTSQINGRKKRFRGNPIAIRNREKTI